MRCDIHCPPVGGAGRIVAGCAVVFCGAALAVHVLAAAWPVVACATAGVIVAGRPASARKLGRAAAAAVVVFFGAAVGLQLLAEYWPLVLAALVVLAAAAFWLVRGVRWSASKLALPVRYIRQPAIRPAVRMSAVVIPRDDRDEVPAGGRPAIESRPVITAEVIAPGVSATVHPPPARRTAGTREEQTAWQRPVGLAGGWRRAPRP